MSGSNHIVGGTVFTGIYLSMGDINIFSSPYFLFFTAFFSLLPDIDHIKSAIGKAFYPLAKYLNKKFGHRTITHSLIVYITLGFIIQIIEKVITNGSTITNIYFWSYGSHLVFDMVTKQGIPLFYPFKKNPCVIPANPYYRIQSSDFKTEAVIFLTFLGLGFTCKDLYAYGFWNTYNKTFDNISHIYAETKQYNKAILLKYNYYKESKPVKGEGFIINATSDNLILFDKGFQIIDNTKRIVSLFPVRTSKEITLNEISFTNISFDSLQAVIKNKAIKDLKIQTALPLFFSKENQPQSSTSINLSYIYNEVFQSNNIDSTDENIIKDISLIRLQLQENNYNIMQYKSKKDRSIKAYNEVKAALESEDLADREKAIKEQQKAKSEIENISQPINNSIALETRLNFLQSKSHIKKLQSITGYISYFTIK